MIDNTTKTVLGAVADVLKTERETTEQVMADMEEVVSARVDEVVKSLRADMKIAGELNLSRDKALDEIAENLKFEVMEAKAGFDVQAETLITTMNERIDELDGTALARSVGAKDAKAGVKELQSWVTRSSTIKPTILSGGQAAHNCQYIANAVHGTRGEE
jgi:hypothetical protein